MAEFTSAGGPLRQSLLRQSERCMLSAKWYAEGSWPNPLTDLGTIVHAIYAEALRRLKATGEPRIGIDDLKQIAADVYAQSPILLPTQQRRDLRWLLWRFADMSWTSRRILYVEERFTISVMCPDGIERQLTGQPDVVIASPPSTVEIVDHKSGMARPPQPRDPSSPDAWLRDHGRAYLSDDGTYQLDIYGALVLHKVPAAQRVVLREYHWRHAEVREATMERSELPVVEAEIGAHLMKLDTALREGDDSPLWRPRPGSHCRFCPRPTQCPIPVEERVGGTVTDDESMAAWARVWVTSAALKDRADKEVKGAIADGIPPATVGDKVLAWSHEGPGRRFGLTNPPPPREGQDAADEAFAGL